MGVRRPQPQAATRFAFVSSLVLLLAIGGAAGADTVRLKNGDVITGKVLKVSGGDVYVDTDYAGEIKIAVDHVVDLETERILTIEYEDGREVDGYVSVGADGTLIVRQATEEAPGEALTSTPPEAGETTPAEESMPLLVDLTGIDEIREVTPFYSYVGNLDFGLNIAKGNTDTSDIALATALSPSFGRNTVAVSGQLNRSKADGELNASNWRILGQYEREFWKKWFAGVFNAYDHDRFQDLDLRITAGAGLGYKFFEPDPTLLKVFLAPAYVNEDFEGSDDDRTFAAMRWTLDFDQDLWSPDVSLYHNHKLTVGITESQFLAQTVQGLKFGLIADFSLKLEFQLDHNNKPADDAKQNDYRYLVKLGYDFNGDENDWWQ